MPHSHAATSPSARQRPASLPDGDERVLDDVGHDLLVVAPPHQAGGEPGSVPVVELAHRTDVAFRRGGEQSRIRQCTNVGAHTGTVAG